MRLDPAVRTQLTKAATRLLLLRGSKQERINRDHIKAALVAHDPAYKKYVSAAVKAAQTQLKTTFGYNIVLAAEKESDAKSYYLINQLKSPVLASILASQLSNPAYAGLLMVVATAIWCAPSGKIEMHSLYNYLRNVDASFLEAGASRSHSSAANVIDHDIGANLSRMEKEGYIRIVKDVHEAKDVMRSSVQLGVRFHIEIGIEQLARSYHTTIGVPITDAAMAHTKNGDFVMFRKDTSLEADQNEAAAEAKSVTHVRHKSGRK